jgi:hypothetical protein
MSRFLSLALCLVCAPAFAIEVSDGDYYRTLRVEGEFLMTGGVVEDLELVDRGENGDNLTYYIEGGQIGVPLRSGIVTWGGMVDISGGSLTGGLAREEGSGKTVFHGTYFQYTDRLRAEYNSYKVRGWLDDGSFLDLGISNSTGLPHSNPAIEFVITPSDGLRGDTDGDWSVGLSDLNAIRNNFGSRADRLGGDVDGSGAVDVGDLNIIRNAFNPVQFFDPNGEPAGQLFEVTKSQSTRDPRTSINLASPVPEPSSLGLMALGAIALSCTLGRCRYLKSLLRWP